MSADTLALSLARIVVAAGEPVAAIYARGFEARRKADASPVTDADLAAERVILERLAAAFPGVPAVAEECVSAGSVPELGDSFFLVDPLDGTREFIARRNQFTVNIAMIENGRPLAGAIYAPLLERVWFGGDSNLRACRRARHRIRSQPRRGSSTYGRPRPRSVARRRRSHHHPDTEAYLARLPIMERHYVGPSLKFCWIAEGLADVYPRLGETREWDTAAGHAILAAAGGDVTTPDGAPILYGDASGGFRRLGFVAVGGFRIAGGAPRLKAGGASSARIASLIAVGAVSAISSRPVDVAIMMLQLGGKHVGGCVRGIVTSASDAGPHRTRRGFEPDALERNAELGRDRSDGSAFCGPIKYGVDDHRPSCRERSRRLAVQHRVDLFRRPPADRPIPVSAVRPRRHTSVFECGRY